MGSRNTRRIAVLGAGSWGTALAFVAARLGHDVRLWARRSKQAEQMIREARNPDYLSDYGFPENLHPTADMEVALANADVILLVPSSQGMRETVARLQPHWQGKSPLVSAAKGLESNTLLRMSEVIQEELGNPSHAPIAALSGPNFAVEIMRGLPAGTVVAADDEGWAKEVQHILSGPELRIYTSDDLCGVELGGALKNIYAIGVGILHSLDLGYNSQATLITRGLAELARLGVHLGAHPFTFAGLSGLGDLVLTCTSDLSRNRRAGLALGQGDTPDEIRARGETIEGLRATAAAQALAAKQQVEMPIVNELNAVLFEQKPAQVAVQTLMERAAKTEREQEFVIQPEAEFINRDEGLEPKGDG